jgi:hypothetical protein
MLNRRPKTYAPKDGYKFQIFAKSPNLKTGQGSAWIHYDYATSRNHLEKLLSEAHKQREIGWEYNYIVLPAKYWPRENPKRKSDRDLKSILSTI